MYELTPQLLNLYQDCPRCLWVNIHEQAKIPTSASPSLMSGMGAALRSYCDRLRSQKNLPPEFRKNIEGQFISDQQLVNSWRDPKRGLLFTDEQQNVSLRGQLDDCIVRDDEGPRYTPIIFQARGFDQPEDQHDQHHQLKLDCFDYLLKQNAFNTTGTGYLCYYIPEEVRESGVVQFNVQVIQIVTEPERIKNLIAEVVGVLTRKIPRSGKNCEYCAWGNVGVKLSQN